MGIWGSRGALLSKSLFLLLIATSCGRPQAKSNLTVSDVAHTPVKRESIGNCWLYATSTWAESLHLSATNNVVNLSESYWTYWDWYYKITGSSGSKINTSGSWQAASRIISKHGYMLEGDFIPGEADKEISTTQKSAEAAINLALSTGALKDPTSRTQKNTLAALDQAFGVNLSSLQEKIYPASKLQTSAADNGRSFTLADEIQGGRHQWLSLGYPQLFGQNPRETLRVRRQRRLIMDRVLRAVNEKKPVIMSTMVEFSALSTDGPSTFDYNLYLNKGYSSGQGGHLVVLEDYVVDNVPGVGRIGEGEVSPSLKEAALQGEVDYLLVKNSWGTDRPERGLTDGYTRFKMDYLNMPLPFGLEDGDSNISHGSWYSALSNFVIPPEF